MGTPALGYGQRNEASIDAVNQWMRGTPWYQQLLRSFGQSPDDVHLDDDQKQQIIRAAQANGVVVDEGHDGQEIDDSGNFQAKSHKLRNTLIVAGIAGAALATMGAAGVFSGAAGAGGAAGGGAAAGGAGAGAAGAGTLASTTIGSGFIPGIAGGTGLAAGAGAAGAAGAASAGLDSVWGAEGLGTGIGTDAAAGGGSALGAAEGASPWLADGTFAGDSTFGSVMGGGGGGGTFARLAEKYGPQAISGAIKGYLGQKDATASRNQQTGLAESQMDPFRGYMHQANDVGKLDLMAEGNFQSTPVHVDSKYGAGLHVQPEQFYTPSTVMRATARGNRDAIAAGNTAPTMTDPANYGKTPVGSYSGAAASSPATAVLAALRAKGLVKDDDNQTSPWLA